MKTPLALAALCLTIATAALANPPTPGQPAPAFTVADDTGKSVGLSAFKGRTVVLEWTNNGCPYVGHMYASGVMQVLQRRAAAEKVVWLTIISSAPGKQGYLTAPQARAWKAREGAASADVLLDPEGRVGRLYDARTTPDMIVIDPAGRVAYAGAIDDRASTDPADAKRAHNYVVAALEAVAAGRAANPSLTKSYGCSVKYR